jgi:hypothetical protein
LLALVVGCGAPAQHAAPALPLARGHGEGGPTPVRFAATRDTIVRIVGYVNCTGALIADDQVLTARACVAARGDEGHDIAPGNITVQLGKDDLPWGEVKVKTIVASSCHMPGEGDLAILMLSRRITGMRTLRPQLNMAPTLGDNIWLFGFGGGHPATLGLTHRSAYEIKSIGPRHFVVPASVCASDLGAPALRTGFDLIGVLSAGTVEGDRCAEGPDRPAIFTRVDAYPHLFARAQRISEGTAPSELPDDDDCPRTVEGQGRSGSRTAGKGQGKARL